MSKVVVLQPSYIPWIGYFEQILSSDIFVFYDDVQYTKNDWRNRNKIKAHNKTLWLSIPVKSSFGMKINEVLIDYTQKWQKKHLKTLEQFYKKSKYFNEVYNILEYYIQKDYKYLYRLNIDIIKAISNYLGIDTKFYLSSKLDIKGNRSERLLNICKFFNATKYYSGNSAKNYLDTELFKNNNIQVIFQEYKHPTYKQLDENFILYLSIVDLLFNYGKESIVFIKGEKFE